MTSSLISGTMLNGLNFWHRVNSLNKIRFISPPLSCSLVFNWLRWKWMTATPSNLNQSDTKKWAHRVWAVFQVDNFQGKIVHIARQTRENNDESSLMLHAWWQKLESLSCARRELLHTLPILWPRTIFTHGDDEKPLKLENCASLKYATDVLFKVLKKAIIQPVSICTTTLYNHPKNVNIFARLSVPYSQQVKTSAGKRIKYLLFKKRKIHRRKVTYIWLTASFSCVSLVCTTILGVSRKPSLWTPIFQRGFLKSSVSTVCILWENCEKLIT